MIANIILAAALAAAACHPAYLIKVRDGDTVEAIYHVGQDVWLGTSIRVAGIDTPEQGRLAQCEVEREKAARASAWLKQMLAPALGVSGSPVTRVCDVRRDKYAGRSIARLELRRGDTWIDVGKDMLASGLAKPYQGGRKEGWCAP